MGPRCLLSLGSEIPKNTSGKSAETSSLNGPAPFGDSIRKAKWTGSGVTWGWKGCGRWWVSRPYFFFLSRPLVKFTGGGLMFCRFHSKHVALRMWFFPAACSVYERDLHGFLQKSRRWKWGRSRGGTVLLRIDHWMSAVPCMHGPICAKCKR